MASRNNAVSLLCGPFPDWKAAEAVKGQAIDAAKASGMRNANEPGTVYGVGFIALPVVINGLFNKKVWAEYGTVDIAV